MSDLICKLELYVYGVGMVCALLLIGGAMLSDIERHTSNECDVDEDQDETDDERHESGLPLG
jgi:hypothetical protein